MDLLRPNEENDRPDRIVIEKYNGEEVQSVCVLLFDEEGREHQVWFRKSTEGYELYEHKAPTRQISRGDVDTYENVRDEARQFMDNRGYFLDEIREVVVDCEPCNEEISTGIETEEDLFDSMGVMEYSTKCSNGHEHSYDKEDMRFST